MKITVKLFAQLGQYLPEGSSDHQAVVEVSAGAAPREVMAALHLAEENCHLVLVNGVYLEPGRRATHSLSENDVLAIWPPVAGG